MKPTLKRHMVSVRCNESEYDALCKRASQAGYRSLSEYIRHLAIYGATLADIDQRLAALEAK